MTKEFTRKVEGNWTKELGPSTRIVALNPILPAVGDISEVKNPNIEGTKTIPPAVGAKNTNFVTKHSE